MHDIIKGDKEVGFCAAAFALRIIEISFCQRANDALAQSVSKHHAGAKTNALNKAAPPRAAIKALDARLQCR